MDPRKRVLVVDDIPESLEATVEEVRQMGCAVTECASVAKAIAILNDHRFDLMILDWRIPEHDGEPTLVDGGALLLDAIRNGGVTAANRSLQYVVVSAQRSTVSAGSLDDRCLGIVGKLSPEILDEILRRALARG